MDVLEGVYEAGHVVDVLEVGWTVLPRLVLVDRHSGSPRAEVDPVAAHLDGAVVVEAVPGERLGRHVHGVLDQRAREVESPILIDPASGWDDNLNEFGDGRPHAELVEQGERCVVDGAAF